MKKIFLILAICLIYMTSKAQQVIPSSIIGKPYKIALYGYEIAEHDFEDEMTWYDAIKACEALGDGWHLPTIDELNMLYKNYRKFEIGGLYVNHYWSSTEDNYNNCGTGMVLNFHNGKVSPSCNIKNTYGQSFIGDKASVRAVRRFKNK
jgi:hypothetical protein